MRLLDNSAIRFELYPGDNQNQSATEGQTQTQGPDNGGPKPTADVNDKTNDSARSVQQSAKTSEQGTTPDDEHPVESAVGYVKDAKGSAGDSSQKQGGSMYDSAKGYASQAQETSKQYQQHGADYIKTTGESVHGQANDHIESGAGKAHEMKRNLPESMQGYAGSAVGYAQNAATGVVGTAGGAVKDVGDTVGNAVRYSQCGAPCGKFELTS